MEENNMNNIQEEKPVVEKTKKEKREKSKFSKFINNLLWVIVIVWMAICVTDYVLTVQEKDPIFCVKEETKEYDDGDVYICTGLGYKHINYNRSNYGAIQFGGFWIKEHDPYAEK